MSSVLEKFTKQPSEVLDFDFDFSTWLLDRSDTIASQTATADTGITVGAVTQLSGVVKVFLSGGTDGSQYKITVTIVTTGGRTKQAEIIVKVKET